MDELAQFTSEGYYASMDNLRALKEKGQGKTLIKYLEKKDGFHLYFYFNSKINAVLGSILSSFDKLYFLPLRISIPIFLSEKDSR